MVNKRGRKGRVQGRGVLRKKSFSSFTRCSRRSFLYVDGVLDDGRDGVMFLLALRRLRRYLFVYLVSKFPTFCFICLSAARPCYLCFEVAELLPDFDFDPVFGLFCTCSLSFCSLGKSNKVFDIQKQSSRNTNTGKANQNTFSKIILENVCAFDSKEPPMVMKAKDNGNMQTWLGRFCVMLAGGQPPCTKNGNMQKEIQ